MRRVMSNRIEDAGRAEADVGEEISERVRLGTVVGQSTPKSH